MISPSQFAHLLKNSTLNAVDQIAILKILPTLSLAQIQNLAQILKADNEAQQRIFATANRKRDLLILKFSQEMEHLASS
ncbi:MAG: hypothetical protein UT36_C0010G0063 [Candidatus Peregrinibacteria bacterium GW2011_GWF2_39_17]|nr:MAG: hypothetical protein UT36_C0010G0063 [Candidatus Peregrinibacteria bacterium GW2011_GWF2_39_17]HCW32309.1 hypothetical protein [Candidatus Peregrinibacteria bacterium]